MSFKHLREEIATRYPALVKRAKRGRSGSIEAFCVECMGGEMAEVERCTDDGSHGYPPCPLYRYRMGGRRGSGRSEKCA